MCVNGGVILLHFIITDVVLCPCTAPPLPLVFSVCCGGVTLAALRFELPVSTSG